MADEHELQLKVDNLKEQLKSMTTELNQKVIGFEEKQQLLIQMESNIKTLEVKLTSLRAEEIAINRSLDLRNIETVQAEASVVKREIAFSSVCEKRESDILARENAVTAREKQIDSKTKEHNELIAGAQAQVVDFTSQTVALAEKVKTNVEKVAEQKREIDLNQMTISSQHILFEEQMQRFQERINEKKEELAANTEKNRKIVEDALEPQRQMKMQEDELKRKRSDLDIYESRIRARWRYMFPDRPINI